MADNVAKRDDVEAGQQLARQTGGAPASVSSRDTAVRFAGLRFTPMSVDDTLAALSGRDLGEPFAVYTTPNAEHVWLNTNDAEFAACNAGSWVSTNDSRILGMAARLGGLDLGFAPGAYVVDRMFRELIGPDDTLSVIGGTVETIAALRDRFGLNQLWHHNPPMGFINDPEAVRTAVDFVATHPARFVFVAMGPPQSEKFCQRVIADGRSTGVGLCIGSSISVVTGQLAVAPDWMERRGLVWLYRLAREPQRLWKRYLVRGVYGLGRALLDSVALRLGLKTAR